MLRSAQHRLAEASTSLCTLNSRKFLACPQEYKISHSSIQNTLFHTGCCVRSVCLCSSGIPAVPVQQTCFCRMGTLWCKIPPDFNHPSGQRRFVEIFHRCEKRRLDIHVARGPHNTNRFSGTPFSPPYLLPSAYGLYRSRLLY